ncbi:MAG TPA: glycoside hydrolase family 27 protein [Acidobacteriaceae bacterium]|nr:glycoside hydrolase family 27 protein [Acidobacteriaceae bacterium]
MSISKIGVTAFILLALAGAALGQDPTLAATPPMGWNSWNHFAGRVTAADVRAATDAMVADGMRDAGYIYVNIDDTWEGPRNAQGEITTNSKFPDMKALADYVHSKGMKLGIYSGPGPKTCAGYPASYGHEQQDADTYAQWGIDYLKYDLCSYMEIMRKEAPNDQAKQFQMMRQAYETMHQALVKTGRPIVFSLCQYGLDHVWTWGPSVGGNLWRTTDDINDTWQRMAEIGFSQLPLARYAGPGHWNDPDMLEVGNGGMTDTEYRTHMSLWAILAAPLLAGNDLSRMTPATKAILLNKEVIAVDQDKLGKEGSRALAMGLTEIWTKPLSGDALAAGLFNRDTEAHSVTLHLKDVGFPASAKLRDLWAHKDVSATDGAYTVTVPGHGVVLLKVSR